MNDDCGETLLLLAYTTEPFPRRGAQGRAAASIEVARGWGECVLVTVAYREPTFEASLGREGPPYRWTFEVDAPDADTARAVAEARFREVALQSGVGWQRQVLGWEVVKAH